MQICLCTHYVPMFKNPILFDLAFYYLSVANSLEKCAISKHEPTHDMCLKQCMLIRQFYPGADPGISEREGCAPLKLSTPWAWTASAVGAIF